MRRPTRRLLVRNAKTPLFLLPPAGYSAPGAGDRSLTAGAGASDVWPPEAYPQLDDLDDDGTDRPGDGQAVALLGPGPVVVPELDDDDQDQDAGGGVGDGPAVSVWERGTVVDGRGRSRTVPARGADRGTGRADGGTAGAAGIGLPVLSPRPVLPAWLRDPRSAIRWAVAYAAHLASFHVVRVPLYASRAVMYTPRGLARYGATLVRWAADGEAADLRRSAVDRGDVGGYMLLSRQRNERVKTRVPLATVAAAGCAALTVAVMAAPATRLLGLIAVVGVAGWHGRPQDRPFLETAVVTSPAARRLTPDVVVQAFTAAGLCKADHPITFAAPIARDGKGWRAVIDLPYGITASKAVTRKEQLAAGLDVDEVRVFVERVRGNQGSARRLVLWVADGDPYAEKSPVTPLAKMASFDFWQPFPFGLDARQRPITLPLVWSSLLVGAVPRMGKTYAARQAAAAAALDPHVRLLIWDGKGGKDWQPFELVAHRYGSGIRDLVVAQLVAALDEAVVDMDRRFEKLRTLPNDVCPESKVTPAIARNRRLDMPLTLIAIDEVQRYLEHAVYGQRICEALTALVKVGPASGYMVVLATQKPDSDVIPDSLRGQVGTRFALKVMTWQASDTILGAGMYKAGLDASKLLRSHRGVGILLGADDGELAEAGGQIVRTYMLDLPTLQAITEKARLLRVAAGTLTGMAVGEEVIVEPVASRLLDEVADCFSDGEDKLWSETITGRLAEANPAVYDGWTATDLANALRPYGVTTNQVWGQTANGRNANRRGVTRAAVLDALAERLDKPTPTPPRR